MILHLNVQSIEVHKDDIMSNPVLQNSDIIVFSKTWMHNDEEPVPLGGFTCVYRSSSTIWRRSEDCSTKYAWEVSYWDEAEKEWSSAWCVWHSYVCIWLNIFQQWLQLNCLKLKMVELWRQQSGNDWLFRITLMWPSFWKWVVSRLHATASLWTWM